MKLWTYGEVRTKLELDLDLQDESFISRNELAGYCNEAIDAAEGEIIKISEDYFLTRASLAMVNGAADIDLPVDIYAQKIRALIYRSGSLIYPLKRIRGSNKFGILSEMNAFSTAQDYSYILMNGTQGEQSIIQLVPPSRETSASNLTLYYIRNARRVPLLGEFEKNVSVRFAGSVITMNDSTLHNLTTGEMVSFSATNLPEELTAGVTYYVIVLDAVSFQVASTLLNAKLGLPIDTSSVGNGIMYYYTTEAIQDETVLDIPEFTTFLIQFMKVRCYEKEPDPRYDAAAKALMGHLEQMVDTLTERVPDNDTKVEMDLSFYTEHS